MPFVDPFAKKEGGTTTTAPRPKLSGAAPAKAGGFVDPFAAGSAGASRDAAPAKKHGGGWFGRLAGDIKEAAVGLPRGVLGIGKAAATDVRATANRVGGLVTGDTPEHLRAQPGESFMHYLTRTAPLTGGLATGLQETGSHVVGVHQLVAPNLLGHGFSDRLKRDYSEHPGLSLINDAANIALVAGPASGALSGAAGRALSEATALGEHATMLENVAARGVGGAATEATAQAARADATAAASRAARLSLIAEHTAKTTSAMNRGALAPALPYSLVGKGLGKAFGPVGRLLADSGAGQTVAELGRHLHLDPESRALRADVLNPAGEAVSEATGRQVALAQRLERIVHDPTERAAVFLVGEKEAPALATARAQLPPDQFARFVEEHYQGSVPIEVANLAADVVEGHAPEAAARIDEALRVGRESPGGRTERAAQYLATGPASRAEQLGNQPMASVVTNKVEPLEARLTKLSRGLADARSAAATERARAGAVEAKVALPPEITRPFEDAVAKVHAATERAKSARSLAGTAEERAIAQGQNLADVVAEVRRARSGVKQSIRSARESINNRLQDALDAGGGLLTRRDFLASAPPGAERFASGLYDLLDELAPAERSALYRGTGRFTPDVWAANVAPALGLSPAATADEVIQHVIDLRRAAVGYGKALQPGASAETIARAAQDLMTSGEEAAYVDRILTGSAEEAAQALASESHPQLVNALYDRVAAALEGRTNPAALDEPARALYDAERAEFARVKAADGLDAARAKFLERVGAKAQRGGVKLGRAQERASIAERQAGLLGRSYDRLSKATDAEKARVASSVEAAPARFRPSLLTGQAVTKLLEDHAATLRSQGLGAAADVVKQAAADVPTTLDALNAAGIDPEHFIHVQPADVTKGQPRSLTAKRTPRSGKLRRGSTTYERSFNAQARGEIDEWRAIIANEATAKLAQMPFAAKLGQGELDGVTSAREAAGLGYEPLTPGAVGPETVFVPEHIAKGFRANFERSTFDKVAGLTIDPVTGVWKASVLALSPAWHVGNTFGNALLATVGAGVSPIELAKQITVAIRDYRASGAPGERQFAAPRRLLTAGPTHAETSYLSARSAGASLSRSKLARSVGKVTGGGAGLIRKSYALNELVDNIGRTAVYLAKKGEGLGEEAALRESLKAMGDFSRMTPFERNVVRRVVPFFAWARHMTQLAFRLPIEHPMRTAWVLHLADTFGNDPSLAGLPDFMRGGIPVGKYLLSTAALNPYGDAGGIITNPGTLARSLNPVLKLGATNIPFSPAYGHNFNKDTGTFTRAPGTGRLDEFGRPVSTAPSLLHQLGGLARQGPAIDSLTGRDKVVRYDTGDAVLSKGRTIPSNKSTSTSLLKLAGINLMPRAQADEIARSVAKKKATLAKTRARDRARRARLSKAKR